MEPKEVKAIKTTKSDLIAAAADYANTTKASAKAVVDAVFDAIGQALANGNDVAIAGFGTFEARERAGRTGRNPQTGAPLEIKPSTSVAFSPAAALKALLN